MNDSPRWTEVVRMLHEPSRSDLERIRELTRAEIAANRADDEIGCGNALYGLCVLLYLVGDPEDVALVHEAKFLNMDTGCMIDSFLLTMQRDRDTMMKMAVELSNDRPRIVEAIAGAFTEPVEPDSIAGPLAYLGLEYPPSRRSPER